MCRWGDHEFGHLITSAHVEALKEHPVRARCLGLLLARLCAETVVRRGERRLRAWLAAAPEGAEA